jgi:hypothetical protein
MTDWRDLLAEQIRGLEAQAFAGNVRIAREAAGLLRVIRAYETRTRQLVLRSDSSKTGLRLVWRDRGAESRLNIMQAWRSRHLP